jgi:methylmalonyl-CoA mutase N-terminal domain/subunit
MGRSGLQRPVAELRAGRDDARTAAARRGARRSRRKLEVNLMEAVLEAARRLATLWEICGIFRQVFGEYPDPAEV